MFYSNDTVVAQYGNLQVIDQVDGYILRDEKILKANYEGEIKYFAEDGQKVENGYKVLEIQKDKVEDETRKKLEIINQRINNLENKKFFKTDIDKLNKEINNIIEEIQESSKNNNVEKIVDLKKELKIKLDKKNIIAGDKSFYNKNIDMLKKEQEELKIKIDNDIQVMKSPVSGLISYYIDGLEDIFTLNNMATIDLEKVKEANYDVTNLRESKNAIINQPLYKVVNNTTWYLVAEVDNNKIDKYKEGRRIKIKISDSQVEGKIYRIIKNEDKFIVIFKINQYMENFHKIRQTKAEISVIDYEGLKIPKDSLIKKDGLVGVYVLDVNRYAVFKEISIVGYDDEFVIIKSNFFYKKVNEEIKTIKTVKLYDEVVRNGDRIREGQIIY
ncbi:hypothetical protein CCE28_13220 [Anaeromicrobium sediminis]|uniref:Uncharacterized protein n=1 Tax=Anaeromicrobium sediminis TaxID=1478221 RepID=A0A267MIU4_9FIRM|nr:hypothetical protein CCE28_13220 [Anaeromicrobium sediminis]